MKYRFIKIAILLAIIAHLSSCVVHHVKTDRRSPGHARYRNAGRYW